MQKMQIPDKVRYILEMLENHGFEAYIVGGCVRDGILGRTPGDWDITTSARPWPVSYTHLFLTAQESLYGRIFLVHGCLLDQNIRKS